MLTEMQINARFSDTLLCHTIYVIKSLATHDSVTQQPY